MDSTSEDQSGVVEDLWFIFALVWNVVIYKNLVHNVLTYVFIISNTFVRKCSCVDYKVLIILKIICYLFDCFIHENLELIFIYLRIQSRFFYFKNLKSQLACYFTLYVALDNLIYYKLCKCTLILLILHLKLFLSASFCNNAGRHWIGSLWASPIPLEEFWYDLCFQRLRQKNIHG